MIQAPLWHMTRPPERFACDRIYRLGRVSYHSVVHLQPDGKIAMRLCSGYIKDCSDDSEGDWRTDNCSVCGRFGSFLVLTKEFTCNLGFSVNPVAWLI